MRVWRRCWLVSSYDASMISKSGSGGGWGFRWRGGSGVGWWVFEESMLLWLSNRVLVGCEGGEPLVVSGGELMVVVDASLEL